jgi:hypothetical protein
MLLFELHKVLRRRRRCQYYYYLNPRKSSDAAADANVILSVLCAVFVLHSTIAFFFQLCCQIFAFLFLQENSGRKGRNKTPHSG